MLPHLISVVVVPGTAFDPGTVLGPSFEGDPCCALLAVAAARVVSALGLSRVSCWSGEGLWAESDACAFLSLTGFQEGVHVS